MKKKILIIKTVLALLAAFIVIGCTNPILPEEVPGTDNNATGTVRFSWADTGQAASRSRATLQDAAKVVITIEAADGTVVYDQKQLNLFNFNGSFISEPLALKVGNYRLTDYLILDSTGTVIYAAPKAGSNQAHLVTAPLPLDFTVTKNGTTKIKPEVVNTDTVNTTPADYGYWTFQFSEVKIFNMLTAVMIYDASTDGFMPTDAVLHVTVDTKATSFALAAKTNTIALNDIAGSYILTFKKAGYDDHVVTYSNAEMKGFFESPLTVVLNKKQTPYIITFADPILENEVRSALRKSGGDITSTDVAGLTFLRLDNKQITNLSGIENLTSLTGIDLNSNKITDITPLATLTNLKTLALKKNQISDITPLSGLTNLTELYLDENRIVNQTPLTALTRLSTLSLVAIGVQDTGILSKLTDLTYLDISANAITDLSPLSTLTKLSTLRLAACGWLNDLSPLQSLPNLTALKVSFCQIKDITPLASLTNLVDLEMQYNYIEDITPLGGLTNLKNINFYRNKVTDLTPLQSLVNLESLKMSDNLAVDLTPLLNNTGVGNGDFIDIRYNHKLSADAKNVQIPALQARGVTVHF